MSLSKTTLFNREGTSDKVYTIWLEQEGKKYMVRAQWGRRGGPMQAGNKTSKPVSLDDAQKMFDKTVKEKLDKGYRPGEDQPAYTHVTDKVDSGLRPMLLTPATEEDLERFITDDNWGAEQKFNGKRILLKVNGGKVTGINKTGVQCPIPEEVEKGFSKNSDCLLDGELIGSIYHVFDIMETTRKSNIRALGRLERHTTASGHALDADSRVSRCIYLALGTEQKRKLVEELRKTYKEGIVFKKLDAPYVPGRIETLSKAIAVKIKFYKSVIAQVIDWTDKNSVEVGLLKVPSKSAALISVGKVTVPAKYKNQINKGSLVRVKYLYATVPGKHLYQAHLDPTEDGLVVVDDRILSDPVTDLKFEGKEDE